MAASVLLRVPPLDFRLLFEANPIAALVLSLPTCAIVAVSDGYLRLMTNCTRNDLLGCVVFELGHPTGLSAEELRDSITRINKSGTEDRMSLPLVSGATRDDSVHRCWRVCNTPIFDGHTTGASSIASAHYILHQVEELSRLQHLEQPTSPSAAMQDMNHRLRLSNRRANSARQAKGDFLSNMSHEIRTPLNAILSISALLQDEPKRFSWHQQQKFALMIRTAGEQLLTMLNDVLEAADMEAGRLVLDRHPLHLRECIEDTLQLVAASEPAHSRTELAYEVIAESELDLAVFDMVLVDAARLRQVLLNLTGNAVKFCKSDQETNNVLVQLILPAPCDTEEITQPHFHQFRINIRDSGIGIGVDQLSRLFHPFSQADSSSTRPHGGAGLGLSICKRIVEAMDGRIWAESGAQVPEGGSMFAFTMRAELPDTVRSCKRNSAPAPSSLEFRDRRILLVEDNAMHRRILSKALAQLGVCVTECSSANEALGLLRAKLKFDLIIVDYDIDSPTPSDLDGLALAYEIRNLLPAAVMPLVMMIRLKSEGMRLVSRATSEFSDIQALWTKPISLSRLPTLLCRHLLPTSVQSSEAAVLVAAAAEAAKLADATSTTGSRFEDSSRSKFRILLAEDNPVNQRVVQLLLAKFGYQVDIVNNGREALHAVEAQTYSCILMDIQMPEMDGLEATRRIRAMGTRLGIQPYIIATTASALDADRNQCLSAGMDSFLSKPLSAAKLHLALAQLVH